MKKLLLALLFIPALAFAQWVPSGNNPTPGAYTTYNFDGDQSVMSNTDLSKFRVGGWAQASGTLNGLLTGSDFFHQYWCHNVATNSTTGIIGATDDPTSTSYCYGFTDAGIWTGFQAPAGATAVFNVTAPISMNLITGAVSFKSINGVTTDSTTNKPVTAASLNGGTFPISATAITLPAATGGNGNTPASNSISTVEYGTWVPVLVSTGASFTYTQQVGSYTKIGRLVFAQCSSLF